MTRNNKIMWPCTYMSTPDVRMKDILFRHITFLLMDRLNAAFG